MDKTIKLLRTIIFLVLIGLPLLLSLFSIETNSALDENKSKTKFPELNLSKLSHENGLKKNLSTFYFAIKSFKIRYENYSKENIAFRSQAFSTFKSIKNRLGSQILPNKVIEGEQGWYFMGNSFNNVLKRSKNIINFSENEKQTLKLEIESRFEFCKDNNIAYYLAIAPNKHSVYGDKINIKKDETKISEFEQLLSIETHVPVIDLSKGFKDLPNQELYHKYDSHWNTIGAFSAYNTLMQQIKLEFDDLELLKLEEFDQLESELANTDLLDMLKINNEVHQVKLSYRDVKAGSVDHERMSVPENFDQFPMLYEMHYAKPAKKYEVLFFRDSFFEALKEFMSESFNEVHYFWDYKFRKDAILKHQPDIVVDIIVERNITKLLDKNNSVLN